MLEAGGLPLLKDGIREADDDNPKGYYEFERVKKLPEGDVEWLPEAQGKVVKIISYLLMKLPDSFNYRVIFMQRRIAEVMASQRKMILRRSEDPDKVSEEELAGILENHLRQVADWIDGQTNIEKIDMDFKDIVQNPEVNALRVNQFLGDSLNIDKMVQVIDPNLYRQRA
jgi:hypothetical protein